MPKPQAPAIVSVDLLQGLARHGALHLQVLGDDLAQIETMLTTTVETLEREFLHMAELAGADAGPRADAWQLAEVTATTGRLVTALQFHDLCTQVLMRAQGRIAGMHHALDELARRVAAPAVFEPDAALHRAAFRRMQRRSAVLAARQRRTVHQKELEHGTVELF